MTATFCGHGEVYDSERIESAVTKIVVELIRQGVTVYYLGGFGQFDQIAARHG